MFSFGPGKSFLSIPLLNTRTIFRAFLAGELDAVSMSECVCVCVCVGGGGGGGGGGE